MRNAVAIVFVATDEAHVLIPARGWVSRKEASVSTAPSGNCRSGLHSMTNGAEVARIPVLRLAGSPRR